MSSHPPFASVKYYPGHTSIRQDERGRTHEAWFESHYIGLTANGDVWAKDRRDGSEWRQI